MPSNDVDEYLKTRLPEQHRGINRDAARDYIRQAVALDQEGHLLSQ